MFRRTQLQLTVLSAAIFLVGLIAFEVFAYASIVTALDDQVDTDIEDAVEEVLSDLGPLRDAPPAGSGTEPAAQEGGVFVLVFDAAGDLVANPSDVRLGGEQFPTLVSSALRGRRDWETFSSGGERLRVLVAPVVERGQLTGAVIGGRSLQSRDDRVQIVLFALLGGALGGLALSLGAGYLIARRAVRPLRTAYEQQEAFVADASHELRTPVAVIRTSADLLLREDLTPAQRELVEEISDVTVEAASLVEDLLALAHPRPPGSASVSADLAAAVEEETRLLEPLLSGHGTQVHLAVEPAVARIHTAEARRVVRALLENVVGHTPPGTGASIEVVRRGSVVVLIVEDAGPGVGNDQRDRIFDRFVQLDDSRTPTSGSGAGLGLAIVRSTVEARGGTVVAREGARGGLQIEVTLPAA